MSAFARRISTTRTRSRSSLETRASPHGTAQRPTCGWQTILKLTSGFTGTHPSTFERKRAWAHRIASHESAVKKQLVAASERRGNNLKGLKDLYLKAKAKIWPRLSYVPHSLDGELHLSIVIGSFSSVRSGKWSRCPGYPVLGVTRNLLMPRPVNPKH